MFACTNFREFFQIHENEKGERVLLLEKVVAVIGKKEVFWARELNIQRLSEGFFEF